jgi:transposase
MQVLSDAQWSVLAPLIEACRPKGKTPLKHLRRIIEAILWRHQNDAKWRAIPEELGPSWAALSERTSRPLALPADQNQMTGSCRLR